MTGQQTGGLDEGIPGAPEQSSGSVETFPGPPIPGEFCSERGGKKTGPRNLGVTDKRKKKNTSTSQAGIHITLTDQRTQVKKTPFFTKKTLGKAVGQEKSLAHALKTGGEQFSKSRRNKELF